MTDQVRIGDDGQLEIERTWDGQPLWSVETQQDELFAGDAFQQMPGQLPIEEQPHWVDRIYENRRQERAEAAERCYCPDDCACHKPWRATICGCDRHES